MIKTYLPQFLLPVTFLALNKILQDVTKHRKKTHSFKREACARTRHRYKINFKIIRELNFTVINMLMALMGKVGNMQEQIDNVKRKTRTKNQEKIHLLIFEY